MEKKQPPWILLVCTGAGNTIQGGADIWVNNFLKEVWPNLPNNRYYRLLIDSKRPGNFREDSLPKNLKYHFHFDDEDKTQEWCSESEWIHFLHPNYHHREHLWKHEDKFGICFVHAYPRDMTSVMKKMPELDRIQLQTKVDVDFYDDFLLTCKRRIWIGLTPTLMKENFPNYTYTIPNYYEFQGPAQLTTHVDNEIVGFASRAESRKCLHWMNGIKKGYALTGQYDVINLKETTSFTLPNIDIFQWNPNIYQAFMGKNWGIFHGAYFKEPFGYSIFQALDYGKLPIINTDWCPQVDYKYRAGTKNEFDSCLKQIKKDSHETRVNERNKLIEYLKKYDNKKEWVDQVRTQLLSFF